MVLTIIVAVIVISAGIGLYFITQNQNKNTNIADSSTANLNSNTAAAANANKSKTSNADLKQYDGKVIAISSADGKVTGKIAMAYQASEEMPLRVVYFLKVKDTLPKKATSFAGESYNYIGSHDKLADIRADVGTGVLSAIFCYADQMPDVLALAKSSSIDVQTYTGCAAQSDVYASTDTFYQVYSEYHNIYDFDYNEIIGKDTLAVFDASSFYTADPSIPGGYSYDRAQVISQGTITATYKLTYSE